MKRKNRPVTYLSIILTAVCALFLISGCGASKNMLAAIFGDGSGKAGNPGSGAAGDRLITDPDESFRLARHFQKSGRHRLAVDELLRVVKADPGHAAAYNALGVSYDRLREFGLAAAAYREALRIDPNLDYVYNNIGYSNLLQGNLEAAAAAFETAVALKSETAIYQNNLALAYARLGKDPAEAAAVAAAAPAAVSTAAQTAGTPPLPAVAAPVPTLAAPVPTLAATAPDNHPSVTPALFPIEHPEVEPGQPEPEAYYTIQIGVYYDLYAARQAMMAARENGLTSPYITQVDRGQGYAPYFRVRAGKFETRSQAEHLAAGIRTDALTAPFTVMETGDFQALHAEAETSPARHGETLMFSSRDRLPVIIQTNRDIEILNGNGVRHMARDFQHHLAARGVTVDHIGNAGHFRHPKTIIYYSPGYYGQAKQLLAEIQKIEPAGRLVKSRHMDRNIRIVLGRDIMDAAEKLGQKS